MLDKSEGPCMFPAPDTSTSRPNAKEQMECPGGKIQPLAGALEVRPRGVPTLNSSKDSRGPGINGVRSRLGGSGRERPQGCTAEAEWRPLRAWPPRPKSAPDYIKKRKGDPISGPPQNASKVVEE